MAQDLPTALGEAESRAKAAALEVEEREAAVAPAESRFEASTERAIPARAAARAADSRVAGVERRLRARHLAAQAKLSRLQERKRDAEEGHDETVQLGIGFALAALIAAAIALFWDRFRDSDLVAPLTRLSPSQAIGLCVGGGLLMVILGAALSSADGILGVIGSTLFALGFVLANALVLARHSAKVHRGHSRPILHRKRLPQQVGQITAGVFAALCLIGLGTAVFAGESESSEASAALRQEAEEEHAVTPALISAKGKAALLDRKAAPLITAARADRRTLRVTRRKLALAERRLSRAESDATTIASRLAALEEREQRHAEAERQRAEKLAAEEAAEAEELAAEECSPNYSGCLDPNASDYDCAGGSGDGPLYTGTVEVIGYDEYGLDADGDGIGCETP